MKNSDLDLLYKDASAEKRRKLDEDIASDTRKAYSSVTRSLETKDSPCGVLQQIARTFLKWDTERRAQTRARKALKVLADVPLKDNASWMFESSLRDAITDAVNESAQADADIINNGVDSNDDDYMTQPKKSKGLSKAQFEENYAVRRAFMASIKIDADPSDLAKMKKAIAAVQED